MSTPDRGGILRLRGLPFSSGVEAVRAFFLDFPLAEVVLCKRNGRSTGEAYVEFEDKSQELKPVIEQLNGQFIGTRFLELFEATEADFELAKAMSVDRTKGHVIRMRGLPYSASANDVIQFLAGVEIARGIEGIVFTYAQDGRPTGEALVEMKDAEAVAQALGHHKEPMGSRYIEVFNSAKSDFHQAISNNRLFLGSCSRQPPAVPLGQQSLPMGLWGQMLPVVYQQGSGMHVAGRQGSQGPLQLPEAQLYHMPGSAMMPGSASLQHAADMFAGMHLGLAAASPDGLMMMPQPAWRGPLQPPSNAGFVRQIPPPPPQAGRPSTGPQGFGMAQGVGPQHALRQPYVTYQQPPRPGGSLAQPMTMGQPVSLGQPFLTQQAQAQAQAQGLLGYMGAIDPQSLIQ